MELRTLLIIFSCLVTFASLGFFGIKFLQKKNYLLGIEWLILSASSGNFAVYWLTFAEAQYNVAIFFDAFSRLAGMTLITILGMMVVSHRFKPSTRFDTWAYVISAAATVLVLYVYEEVISPWLAYIYLGIWYVTAIYLADFCRRLFAVGRVAVGLHMIIATLSLTILHTAYDFYEIPGNETNLLLNFYFIAFIVWAYGYSAMYYGYIALEQESERITDARSSAGLEATGGFSRS